MTKGSSSYRIVGFEMLHPRTLRPHAAAKMPIDDEDRESIAQSVREQGVMQPLLVMKEGDGPHWILDGVNRWMPFEGVGEEEDDSLPCMIVETDDPAGTVAECMLAGRKRTTGQRIIVYLSQHKKEVLQAYEITTGRGENLRKLSVASREATDNATLMEWTAPAIAKRMRWSKDDVLAGIQMLDALEQRRLYEIGIRGKRGKAPEEYLGLVAQERDRILCGDAGIRRWQAAVGGRHHTRGKKKRDPDYTCLIPHAAVTLENGFKAWGRLKWRRASERQVHVGQEDEALLKIQQAVAAAPEKVRAAMADAICACWPGHDLQAMRKALGEALKERDV